MDILPGRVITGGVISHVTMIGGIPEIVPSSELSHSVTKVPLFSKVPATLSRVPKLSNDPSNMFVIAFSFVTSPVLMKLPLFVIEPVEVIVRLPELLSSPELPKTSVMVSVPWLSNEASALMLKTRSIESVP